MGASVIENKVIFDAVPNQGVTLSVKGKSIVIHRFADPKNLVEIGEDNSSTFIHNIFFSIEIRESFSTEFSTEGVLMGVY